jgi:hypothetical protein
VRHFYWETDVSDKRYKQCNPFEGESAQQARDRDWTLAMGVALRELKLNYVGIPVQPTPESLIKLLSEVAGQAKRKIEARDVLDPELPSPFSLLPEDAAGYTRAVITRTTAQWLIAVLSVRKLELLKDKRNYLRERGPDMTRFENMLSDIERDVAQINAVTDALT